MIQVERDLTGGNTNPDGCDALHPMGTVPTRVDGELVVTEAATCCPCIATKYPDAALAPATGSDDWATTLRWLTLLTNIVQASFLRWYLTDQYTGGAAGLEAVHEASVAELTRVADVLAARCLRKQSHDAP